MERQDEPLTTRDLAGGRDDPEPAFRDEPPPAQDAQRDGPDPGYRDEPDPGYRDEAPGDRPAVNEAPGDRPAIDEAAGDRPAVDETGQGPEPPPMGADPAPVSADPDLADPAPVAAHPEPATTGSAAPASGSPAPSAETSPELLPERDRGEFQDRWEQIQTGFIDEPRQTVEQADALVATIMQRLAEGFAQEREQLEQQWARGEDISTEDLRVALQRYRSFFQRLLSA